MSALPEATIRRAVNADAGALAALVRGIGWFGHVNAEAPEATQGRVQKHLALCLADDSHSIYVAEEANGPVVGYVAVHWLPYFILPGPEGYVSELFISDTQRGQGLGMRLLDVVKVEALERGCVRLSLLNNETRPSYQRGFYSKQGWEERAMMRNFVYLFNQEKKP